MDASQFETLANETLESFMDVIEEVLGDHLDVDVEAGILNIELDSGGQYIINKHAPNQQIWMSSPKSGASHYKLDESLKNWVSTRGGDDLKIVLAAELSQATGIALRL